jgi:hypothetical protein
MVRRVFALSALSLVMLTATAPAGLIFNRKPKQDNSAEPAHDPVWVLRNDADEHHRWNAVENLSRVDLKQFPQAGPALAEALLKDSSPLVRSAAADALGRLRPMSSPIGMALEQAEDSDQSTAVRNAARRSLAAYVHAGYHPSATGAPQLAPAGPSPSAKPSIYRPASRPVLPPVQTNEPPVAKSIPTFVIPPPSQMSGSLVSPPPPSLPAPQLDSELERMLKPKSSAIEMSPEPVKPPTVPAPNADKPKDSKPAGKSEAGPILNGPG